MTMATGFYGLSWEKLLEGGAIDIDTDTLKALLVTNTYTPNFETDDFHADITNEVSGTGYTAGGVTIAGLTSAISAGTYTLDVNDYSWTTATFTARGDVLYSTAGGSSATNCVLIGRTYGSDFAVSAGTFTTQQNASGVWTAAYR